MKLPDISLFKGWPTLQPELAVAGTPAQEPPRIGRSNPLAGVMLFASSGGGNDDDGYDDDLVYDEPVEQPTRRSPGAQRNAGASSGGGRRGGNSGGRPRSVQFQPEERYWTEYLRIALPILGLLLMIGLLWFWALQLMDDDEPGGDQPVVTEPAVTQEVVVPDSTPTTEVIDQVVATPPLEPTPTVAPSTPDAPAEEPPAETTGGGEIAIDSIVQTTEEGVNMREDASIGAAAIAQLPAGTTLTITDGPIEADDYTWWQVVNDATGEVGYVVDDFLEPAP